MSNVPKQEMSGNKNNLLGATLQIKWFWDYSISDDCSLRQIKNKKEIIEKKNKEKKKVSLKLSSAHTLKKFLCSVWCNAFFL